ARMPNCTLSLEILSVIEVTFPTGSADVQSESVVSRMTTSYPVRLVSGLALQPRVVRLVPAKLTGGDVWICTFLGVLGLVASAQSAAAFTPVTRAMKLKSTYWIRSPSWTPLTTWVFWCSWLKFSRGSVNLAAG